MPTIHVPGRFPVLRTLRRPCLRASVQTALLTSALLATTAACGRPDDASAHGEAVRAPARSGDVWEIARPTERADAGASLLAYVHGLHVLVLDGDQAYAGMTRLRGRRGDGGTMLDLGGGLSATLLPAGDVMEISFSSGEKLSFQRRGDQ